MAVVAAVAAAGEATGQPVVAAAAAAVAAAAVGSTGWLFVSVEPIAVLSPPNQMDLCNGQMLILKLYNVFEYILDQPRQIHFQKT